MAQGKSRKAGRLAATTRDPAVFARATMKARETREAVAVEMADVIAGQVRAQIVEGDMMGARGVFVRRVAQIGQLERAAAPRDVLRSGLMDAMTALGCWIAALDYSPPIEVAPKGGRAEEPPA